MKIQDLDKPESSGKDYYWKMKYERAKLDRKQDKPDNKDSAPVVYGLFAVIGLVLTVLFWAFFPASLPLAIATAVVWIISGSAKISYDPRSFIWIISFLNALFPILSFII